MKLLSFASNLTQNAPALLKKEWIFALAVVREFMRQKDLWKYFAFMYAVYFVGYLGLLIADVYYIDDLGRSQSGYHNYGFSRHLANGLSTLIHLNRHSTDISPITQLIAIGFISFGSLMLAKVVRKRLSYFALLASAPLGLSPFFLENISYKFDSPGMALAIAAPIFAFLFIRRNLAFFGASFLSVLIALNSYQAANSVYIVLGLFVLFEALTRASSWSKILARAATIAFSYLFTLGFYKLVLVKEVDTYVSSGIIKHNIIHSLYQNTLRMLGIYNDAIFKTDYAYILGVAVLAFLFYAVKTSKINKINAIIWGALFAIFAVLFSQGSYLLLEKPLWAPRAFNGIGVAMAIVFVYATGAKIGKAAAIFGALFLVNQAASYANALKAQDEYAKIRMVLMMQTLNTMTSNDNFQVYIASGYIRNSPVVNNARETFPLIDNLVFQRLGSAWSWSASRNFTNLGFSGSYVLEPCFNANNKIISEQDTLLHKIVKYDNNCFVVNFKY